VLAVRDGEVSVLLRRETLDDLMATDTGWRAPGPVTVPRRY